MPEQPSPLTPRQIYMRAYYAANKDAIKDIQRDKSRAYRKANPDSQKAWHLKNPEYAKKYREDNLELRTAAKKKWCADNPEKVRDIGARRTKRTSGAITPGWIPKLLELQRWTCIVCQKDLRYGYHIDHIEPIARGGENTDFNVQALCPKCNLEKSDKDPILFMQSRGFLL